MKITAILVCNTRKNRYYFHLDLLIQTNVVSFWSFTLRNQWIQIVKINWFLQKQTLKYKKHDKPFLFQTFFDKTPIFQNVTNKKTWPLHNGEIHGERGVA